jgi:probable addiction module antidote protein
MKNKISEITDDDLTVSKWDIVNYLETEEDMARYLDVALQENDPVFISIVLGDIARAKGMTLMAEQTGLARSSLYKALSPDGNPEFSTILKVIKVLGLKLRVTTAKVQ